MTDSLPPQISTLADAYARDLARFAPSHGLDARIEQLVAAPRAGRAHAAASRSRREARGSGRGLRWAAAAGVAALAVAVGIAIGVRLERAAAPQLTTRARDTAWPPPDLSMWPADSVALKIPAEYSAHGTLVAVNDKTRSTGTRYWVDVVVSNDGTLRIENVVPAEVEHHDEHARTPTQTP